MLRNIQKGAEEREELDEQILTKLAREIIRKEQRIDENTEKKTPNKRYII